jgi:hypothetical protein
MPCEGRVDPAYKAQAVAGVQTLDRKPTCYGLRCGSGGESRIE